MGTKGAWTPERRARQAEFVRQTKPWLKSTGPTTEQGKAVSSQNARMPKAIAELRRQRVEIMSEVLATFDRKRRVRSRFDDQWQRAKKMAAAEAAEAPADQPTGEWP